MSQHLSGAPNKPVMPPRVPGVMQQQQPPPSVPGSGSQVVYGIPHATYNMPAAAMPSMSRFAPPSAAVYQTQMPNIRGSYSLVTMPSNVQRMYVPVQQMQAGHAFMRPVAVNPLMASDPSKLLEEQRRIEKERNFQMQQQRLKQFTVAGGKKGSSTAEHLLESMFGKSDSKKRSVKTSKNEGIEYERSPAQICSQGGTAGVTTVPPIQSSLTQSSFVPVCDPISSAKQKSKKDPKELENMMMKCSNLSGSQVPKTFQKPLVKDMPRANHNTSTFIPSDKAVNWNHLSGLDNVFSSPRPRFPSWCQSGGNVPQLFHDIAKLVFNEESQSLDTARLYAIFLSSGLSQKLLAEIWEMVNKSLPGSLTLEEMYAALALIAIAQAGQPFTNTDILHRLPACPVPILKCFAPPQTNNSPPNTTAPVDQVATDQTGKGSVNVLPLTTTVLSSENSRPTTLASVDEVTSGISAWKPFMGTSSKPSSMEDDFDDFKSATPMAVNIPPLSEAVPPLQDAPVDEFDEFKQADQLFDSFKSTTENFAVFPPPEKEAAKLDADLMSPEEDKYSIFRTLQQSNDSSADSKDQPTSIFNNQASSSVEITKEPEIGYPAKKVESEDQEDFGEFLDAKNNFASTSTNQDASTNFTANFADFNKLNSNFPSETPVAASKDAEVSTVNNDTFGDFASFQVSAPPHDIAPDGPFRFCKDNISLAESQSVSSLEFGAFDNFGQSGDSKSSLSRQGSIPSLDLKGVGSEGADDDEFGDMQSAIISTALGPSPLSIETPKVFNEKSPGPSAPAIGAALADKYSVIRSDQVIPEDQHISDWTRCLQGCLNILQTATRIFNQMSCSSVCSEVLSTEEGKCYVKNVIEVYRVVCRISVASSSYEKQCDDLQQLIEDSDQAFHTFSVFLSGSPLMPSDGSLDFSPGVLKVCAENNEKACGVCLLDVDAGSKTVLTYEEKRNKLSYGMRFYHNPCANLWVNCVDPLLPMLTLPQLI